jgi:t-SNARE complex subunit (syntaxin)
MMRGGGKVSVRRLLRANRSGEGKKKSGLHGKPLS